MIVVVPVYKPENLVLLHAIWEHTNYHDSIVIVHYAVDGTQHQDIYIGKQWSELIPLIAPLFAVLDGPLDIVVVNAAIVDLVTPLNDDEEADPLKY